MYEGEGVREGREGGGKGREEALPMTCPSLVCHLFYLLKFKESKELNNIKIRKKSKKKQNKEETKKTTRRRREGGYPLGSKGTCIYWLFIYIC